jgi:hypothetical protein
MAKPGWSEDAFDVVMVKVLPLLIGLVLFTGAVVAAWSQIAFGRVAVEAAATVVEMRHEVSRDSDGEETMMAWPVFDLHMPDGSSVRAVGQLGSSTPCCVVGEVHLVRFRPEDPGRVWLTDFHNTWHATVALGVGSVPFLAWGGIALSLAWRDARTPPPPPRIWRKAKAPLLGVDRVHGPDGVRWVLRARLLPEEPGGARVVESRPLAFDPGPALADRAWIEVEHDGQPGGACRMNVAEWQLLAG